MHSLTQGVWSNLGACLLCFCVQLKQLSPIVCSISFEGGNLRVYLATCVACKISRGMISFHALEGMDNEALTCGRPKPPIYIVRSTECYKLSIAQIGR